MAFLTESFLASSLSDSVLETKIGDLLLLSRENTDNNQ